MNNLSNAQRNVLIEVYTRGFFIVSNEGRDYKCWLEDRSGFKYKNVNRRTIEILFKGGYIVAFESGSRASNIYRYVLSDKTNEYIKKMRINQVTRT